MQRPSASPAFMPSAAPALALLLVWAAGPAAAAAAPPAPPSPSAGCHRGVAPPSPPSGELLQRTIKVSDGNFTGVERSYSLHIPRNYSASGPPLPLLFYFHMQDETPEDAALTQFEALADANDFFLVYPAGESAGGTPDTSCGPAWNVGANGDSRVCTRQAYSAFGCPAQQDGWSCTCCSESCEGLGVCSGTGAGAGCSWSACYSDVAFVATLLEALQKEFCLDTSATFAAGASNGAMLVHELASKMPGAFAAFAPIYGLPLRHHLHVPPALSSASILHIHDRWDEIMPVKGGESSQGWLYTSLTATMEQWGKVHGCGIGANDTVAATSPFDGGSRFLQCQEWSGCAEGRVMWCLFDGYHGDWPDPTLECSAYYYQSDCVNAGCVWKEDAADPYGICESAPDDTGLALESLVWWFFHGVRWGAPDGRGAGAGDD